MPGPAATFKAWFAHWFARSPVPGDSDLDRFSITYQWSYEPFELTPNDHPITTPLRKIPTSRVETHENKENINADNKINRAPVAQDTPGSVGDPPKAAPVAPAPVITSINLNTLASAKLLPQQAAYIRRFVAVAEEEWWQSGQLPSRDLLRSALEVLNSGYTLEPSQLPLLLRTALFYQRGVLTALHYQTDPECTALVLAEAIGTGMPGLTPDVLDSALAADPAASVWRPLLVRELQTLSVTHRNAAVRRRSTTALGLLAPNTLALEAALLPVVEPAASRLTTWQIALIALVAGALLAFIAGAAWAMSTWSAADAVEVTMPDGASAATTLWVDRMEATNADYRRCYRAGACPWPADTNVAGVEDYFRQDAYAQFPVTYVDHAAAAAYCKWQGKRLPTAVEWRVAAGVSPITGLTYRFPWGDTFGATLANGLESARGMPQQVGSYHPAGDSGSGASDMAGNVAEWTATPGDAPGTMMVAGGSYRDPAAQLMVDAHVEITGTAATDWLGIRCVR